MKLTPEQRTALTAAAEAEGIDPAHAIAVAEGGHRSAAPTIDQDGKPKLYMYLLPFVTVQEVRSRWLDIDDPFPGDDEVAAAWAQKFASNDGGGSARTGDPIADE